MSISQQALWFVCGIGAVVFAAGQTSWRRTAAAALGFLFTLWLFRDGGIPDGSWVAGLVLLVSGARLYRPRWTLVAAFAAGPLAGSLGALLNAQGVPPALGWPLAAALPGLTMVLSRNSRFATEEIVEEGVLLMLALAVGAAAGPAILDGWQSAGALNATPGEAARTLPVWVLLTAGTAVLAGGAWSAWRRR